MNSPRTSWFVSLKLHTLFLVLVTIAAPLSLCGCKTSVYTIKAGKHSSTNKVAVFRGSDLTFNAMFDESAIYQTENPSLQSSINKLYGFSDCSSHHHKNSARVGWRWWNEELQILAYTYVDGDRISRLMGTVDINVFNSYKIEIDRDTYRFTLNDNTVIMDRGCTSTNVVKYRLWPYFGGQEPAPHNVTIYIEET